MRRRILKDTRARLTPRDWLPVAAAITEDANRRVAAGIIVRGEDRAAFDAAKLAAKRAWEASAQDAAALAAHEAAHGAARDAWRKRHTAAHEAARAATADLSVQVGPKATVEAGGAPAFYRERDRVVVLDSEIALPGVAPASVRWSDRRWRLEHLRAAGLVEHEVGHAAHTPRRSLADWYGAGQMVGDFGRVLEETRMEASHLRAGGDREALAGVASELILREWEGLSGDPLTDAVGSVLILGRDERHGGSLASADVEKYRDAYASVHGADWLAAVDELVGEWNGTEDSDVPDGEGMAALLARWRARFGQEGEDEGAGTPGPGGAAEEGEEGTSGAGEGAAPADGDGGEEAAGSGDGQEGEEGDAAGVAEEKLRELLEEDAGEARSSARTVAEELREEEEEEDGAEVKRVVSHAYSGGGAAHHPVREEPLTAEAAQLRSRLVRELRRLQLPEVARTRVASELPPGRLRGRGAVLRDAQRAAGMVPTAEPFRATRKRVTKAPPPVVGIMLDVSGSMGGAQVPVATVGWALAEAGRAIQARTAVATFGDRGRLVEHRPGALSVTAAMGGWENFREAFSLLDGRLHLTSPARGARVLIVVTDGQLVGPGECVAAQRIGRWLERHGVAVVWAAIGVNWGGGYGGDLITCGSVVELRAFGSVTEAALPLVAAIEDAVSRARIEAGR